MEEPPRSTTPSNGYFCYRLVQGIHIQRAPRPANPRFKNQQRFFEFTPEFAEWMAAMAFPYRLKYRKSYGLIFFDDPAHAMAFKLAWHQTG